jgi:quercetin dioxygenase-like cupin family protein
MMRSTAGFLAFGLLSAPTASLAAPVPDALAVEWHGHHPCEKLYEDTQIRVARCTFPPGAMHVRHSHPGYLAYVLHGGKGEMRDTQGRRPTEYQTGQFIESPPIAWHEFTNNGDTTIRYLIIEKKYEPVPTK